MKYGGGARGFITVKGEIKKLKNKFYVWKSWRNLSTGRAGRANPPTAICCSAASLHRSPNDFTSDFLSVSLCSFFAFKTMISSFGRNDYHNIKKIAFLFNEFYSSGMQWRNKLICLSDDFAPTQQAWDGADIASRFITLYKTNYDAFPFGSFDGNPNRWSSRQLNVSCALSHVRIMCSWIFQALKHHPKKNSCSIRRRIINTARVLNKSISKSTHNWLRSHSSRMIKSVGATELDKSNSSLDDATKHSFGLLLVIRTNSKRFIYFF